MRTRQLGPLRLVALGEGRCFRLNTLELAVFRPREGGVHATDAACPHKGGPLADGILGGCVVVCPLHGRKWDLTTGAPIGHDGPPLRLHRVRVRDDGELLLEREPESPGPTSSVESAPTEPSRDA